jgi:RES domain
LSQEGQHEAGRFLRGMLAETVPAGGVLIRVHNLAHVPLWFGPRPGIPPQYRFDAPNGEYRVLYCAARLAGAFVESVLRRPASRIVARAHVEERGWSELTTRRALRLVKLRDEGLHWHGTDAAISASEDHGAPRRMALALYNAFPEADGIAYRARHNNGEVCYAVFDRVPAADLVPGLPQRFAEHRAVVDQLMALHGALFDTDLPVPPP